MSEPATEILVATSGRTVHNYVGTFPGGRRIPGGPRPQELVIGVVVVFIITVVAATFMPFKTVTVFGVGLAVEVVVIVLVSLIKWDGVPILNKMMRLIRLLAVRKPIVVAVEELDRQVAANPNAFIVDDGGQP